LVDAGSSSGKTKYSIQSRAVAIYGGSHKKQLMIKEYRGGNQKCGRENVVKRSKKKKKLDKTAPLTEKEAGEEPLRTRDSSER